MVLKLIQPQGSYLIWKCPEVHEAPRSICTFPDPSTSLPACLHGFSDSLDVT